MFVVRYVRRRRVGRAMWTSAQLATAEAKISGSDRQGCVRRYKFEGRGKTAIRFRIPHDSHRHPHPDSHDPLTSGFRSLSSEEFFRRIALP